MIPYNVEYSSANSGDSLVVFDCDNINYNGIDGCIVSDYDSGCGNGTLSVYCERGSISILVESDIVIIIIS